MKRIMMIAAMTLVPIAASASAVGLWQTQKNDAGHTAQVKIAPCGDALCGVIVSSSAADSKAIGLKMVWDMRSSDKTNYSGGRILDPSSGKEYKSKMTVQGNSLKVEGCVAVFCKAQTWTRIQ